MTTTTIAFQKFPTALFRMFRKVVLKLHSVSSKQVFVVAFLQDLAQMLRSSTNGLELER